jgi:hypothetical protein
VSLLEDQAWDGRHRQEETERIILEAAESEALVEGTGRLIQRIDHDRQRPDLLAYLETAFQRIVQKHLTDPLPLKSLVYGKPSDQDGRQRCIVGQLEAAVERLGPALEFRPVVMTAK